MFLRAKWIENSNLKFRDEIIIILKPLNHMKSKLDWNPKTKSVYTSSQFQLCKETEGHS